MASSSARAQSNRTASGSYALRVPIPTTPNFGLIGLFNSCVQLCSTAVYTYSGYQLISDDEALPYEALLPMLPAAAHGRGAVAPC